MQIHELNNFGGNLDASAFLAVDNGTDTGKASVPALLTDVNNTIIQTKDELNARIDNIIAGGDAPSAAEVTDARKGFNNLTYASLGDAIRGQVLALRKDLSAYSKLIDYISTLVLSGNASEVIDIKNGIDWEQGRYYFTENFRPSYALINSAYTFEEVFINGFNLPITFSVAAGYSYSVAGINDAGNVVYRLLGRTDTQTVNLGSYTSFILYIVKSDGTEMSIDELSNLSMTITIDQSTIDKVKSAINIAEANQKILIADTDDITDQFTLTSGDLYKNTGEVAVFANGRVLSKNVNPGDTYIIRTQGYNPPFPLYVLMDSNNDVIDYKYGVLDAMNDAVIAIPEDGAILHINAHVNSISLTTAKIPSPIARKKQLPSSQWLNKNVVWIGTSIPCGLPNNNYPDMVGDILSCNMNNVAIGESSMWCKRPDRIDADHNPYGFVENWVKCARCLTNTIEETTWVLDHYNEQDGDGNYIFTVGRPGTAPTQQQRAVYLSCSYENRITPLLSTDVDCWVFDHGHNDDFLYYDATGTRKTLDEMIALYGINNLYTFETACYFLFDMIVNANNKARIVMIGELDNRLSYVKDHQIIVSDSWEVPLYHTWEYLGWNVDHTITTTGYWDNGYWVDSGGPEQQITIHDRFIPDHMHPHSDASGYANEWIATNISKWLANIAI